MSEPEFLTPAEYARLRRCSIRTLDRERATGVGCRYVRLGNRILYRRADIDSYVVEHLHGGHSAGLNDTSQSHQRGRQRKNDSAAVAS